MKSFKFKSRLLFSCLAMFVFSTVLFISCDNEEILVEQQEKDANDDASLNRGPNKIDVCHYSADDDKWFIINVNEKAWPDHMLHGDVRLDDQDGDGYVPDNECGIGPMGDCDDNDDTIYPGGCHLCDYISDLLACNTCWEYTTQFGCGDLGLFGDCIFGYVNVDGCDWGCVNFLDNSFTSGNSCGNAVCEAAIIAALPPCPAAKTANFKLSDEMQKIVLERIKKIKQ